MSHRGRIRASAALAIVALLGAATSGCDDGPSPVEHPTPSVEGTPPSDRDSYEVSEIDLTTPPGAPATVADRLLRVGGTYVLLGHNLSTGDGTVWVSSDLQTWDARGGWISGYSGVQRIVGLVEHNGSWIGAYNERPSGLPRLAWHVSTPDAGRNWYEETLPAATSRPSSASGVVAVGDRVVVAGSRTVGKAKQPVVWSMRGDETWKMIELETGSGGSIAPRRPFLIGNRVAVPGAAREFDGDEVVASTPLLWSSDDGGRSFERRVLPTVGSRSVPLFGLHTTKVDLLFGWSGSDAIVWRSDDEGRTWRVSPESLLAHPPEGQSYPSRAVRAGDCLVLAGVIGVLSIDHPVPAAMWRSCDEGKSWSRMATDELAAAGATDVVGLIGESGSLVLVTNSADDRTVRLLRLDR